MIRRLIFRWLMGERLEPKRDVVLDRIENIRSSLDRRIQLQEERFLLLLGFLDYELYKERVPYKWCDGYYTQEAIRKKNIPQEE